jgi:putative two-component system response regulator
MSEPGGRLAAVLERRSADTSAHQLRIARLTQRLAREMGFTEEEGRALELAASMHDIGKIVVPRRVLAKPGTLGPVERKIVQTHTVMGALLLFGKKATWMRLARTIALHHHERWDGLGYPRGLIGKEIPLGARIVAVADVFDALTHRRIYRPAFPEARAVEYMRTQSGLHFDPEVIECFLDLLPELTGDEASAGAA